jgi:hypothetical protein
MKKLFLCFLFIILLIPSLSYADTCTYTDIETYSELGTYLVYEGTSSIAAEALIISDFTYENNQTHFLITNPNDFEVTAVLSYPVEGECATVQEYGKRIAAGDAIPISEHCYREAISYDAYVSESNVSYYVSKPFRMTVAEVNAEKERDVCDKACTEDSECGTTCNIAGYCGTITDVCPEGTTSCNGLACFVPNSVDSGQTYFCDWQCASGFGEDGVCKSDEGGVCEIDSDCNSGSCNFAGFCGEFVACPNGTTNCNDEFCLAPSTKEFGEDYICEFQCESGNGEDGVCGEPVYSKILKAVFVLFIIAISIFGIKYALDIKREKEHKERLEKERKEHEKKIKDEQKEHQKKIRGMKNQVDGLSIKIQNSEKEIQQLRNLSVRTKSETERLRSLTEEKDKQQVELEKKSKSYYFDLYTGRYGKKIHLDKHEYLCFANGEKVHHYIYRMEYGKNSITDEVHHIDANHFNNEVWNLINLSHYDHRRIGHSKINFGDWESGIAELKRIGFGIDQLPSKIQEKLRNKSKVNYTPRYKPSTNNSNNHTRKNRSNNRRQNNGRQTSRPHGRRRRR